MTEQRTTQRISFLIITIIIISIRTSPRLSGAPSALQSSSIATKTHVYKSHTHRHTDTHTHTHTNTHTNTLKHTHTHTEHVN